jgi:hypothetical protein
MDKEVHQKITASTVAKALSAGNFAAYDVLDRSGQLDKLEPSVAAVIRVAHRAARAEARVKLPLEFAKEEADLIALSVNPRATREALTLGTEALNAKYRRFTGDPGKYRDSADLARDMVRLDATYRQEQAELERQRKEATSHMQKEAIKLQEIDATVERLRTGRSVDASAESQTIAWGVLGAKNPEVVNFARVRGAGGYPPVIDVAFKDELQRTVGEAKAVVTAEDAAKGLIKPEARPLMFHEAYAKMYLPLVQAAGDKDQEVALAYAGPHGEALSKYHSFFIGRAPSTITEEQKIVAYQNAIREEPKKSDPKTVKAIAEALANNAWFDEDQMPIVHSEELAKILAPHSVSTASAENKASQAQSALADKLSVVGGHYWWKSAGATDIKDYWVMQANKLPPGEDTRGVITGSEHNRAMRNAVDQLAVEAGLDPATVIVHQGSDLNGVPQFIIKGADSKQNAVLLGLPAEAITARWLKKENRMTKAKFEEAERLVKTGPGFVNGKFDPFAKPN